MFFTRTIRLFVVAVSCVSAACASGSGAKVTRVTPEQPVAITQSTPTPTAPPVDHIGDLLKKADDHFEIGRHELTLGHLAKAKAEFNLALEVLLESPDGTKSDARVREHFERLVDRIASLELSALATGDGFTE